MKLTLLFLVIYCTLVPCIIFAAETTKAAEDHHGAEHSDGKDDDDDDENENDEFGFGKDSGSKKILGVLWRSCKKGRRHVYKVIDKYLKKEDLDKKLLEVAKIIGKRLEKRMEYFAKKLDSMFNYETS
ncbi:unnamed protein product [Heterobilharzia americana]|nr:unnamed protein product [Heterobilharzia americana]